MHVLPNHAVLPRGVKAPGGLVVGERARLGGGIHARGPVHLARGAVVNGDIVAMGDVVLGAGVHVHGRVRAEGNVTIQRGAVVVGEVDAAHDVLMADGARVGKLVCGGDLRAPQRPAQSEVRGHFIALHAASRP